MKKKILSLAVLMTIGVFAYANSAFTNVSEKKATVLVQDDAYKTVEVSELPEAIQEVVKAYEELYTIESVAYNEAESLTKLNLVSKLDGTKKEVIIDKEGKELEPTEETPVEPAV